MPGAERQPSLTVYRPLSGIDKEQMSCLRARLKEVGSGSSDVIRDTVARAHKLRASLLMRDELRAFYESQGLSVSPQEVADLGKFIRNRRITC